MIRVHQAGEGCGGSGVQGEAQGAADSVPGATSLLSARGGGGQGRGGGWRARVAPRPQTFSRSYKTFSANSKTSSANCETFSAGWRQQRKTRPSTAGRPPPRRPSCLEERTGPWPANPPPLRWEQRRWSNYREGDPARCVCRSACQSLRRSVCQSVRRACAGACAGECARACSRHVSRMPTPLATQAPDDLGLKATLQWERPCGDMGLDTALEGKEPGCGSGWRDRPGTEGTTVGQPTQGREWCFIGQGSRLSSKQAWRFSPAPRGYVHYFTLNFSTHTLAF